jgi:hypothetical protein
MGLNVTGKITTVLEKQSGTTKTGSDWETQTFILDNNEKYNNIFAFDLFGSEKIQNFEKYNKIGQTVNVDFNINCREYKGRYYTSLSAWKISKAEASTSAPDLLDAPFPTTNDVSEGNDDDLPF